MTTVVAFVWEDTANEVHGDETNWGSPRESWANLGITEGYRGNGSGELDQIAAARTFTIDLIPQSFQVLGPCLVRGVRK